jgi:L-ascorbate metabolism protein UlaG (beta-lactamase superfamily)
MPHRTGPFVNVDGSGPVSMRSVFKFMSGRITGKHRRSPARAPVRRVEPDVTLLATPPAPGEPARLTWLGHASWLVQLEGVSLLIDPALQPVIGFLVKRNVEPGLAIGQLPKIDACLVTHNHYDHLDLPTLVPVGAPVIAGLANARHFSGTKLPVTELDWWESTPVGAVRVTYVPSQHWSRRGVGDTNVSLWGGFVIESKAQGTTATLYHSGDTAYFDGFAEIGRRFPGLDAAMLPIGAYDPPWFMERQHMNPEQAVQAFQDLGARRFFAMHWGTFKLTDEPLLEPPERLQKEWAAKQLDPSRLGLLDVGQTVSLDGPPTKPAG